VKATTIDQASSREEVRRKTGVVGEAEVLGWTPDDRLPPGMHNPAVHSGSVPALLSCSAWPLDVSGDRGRVSEEQR
jgi:hypothetical protein